MNIKKLNTVNFVLDSKDENVAINTVNIESDGRLLRTCLNCEFKDYEKLIFKRCIDTVVDSTNQQLVRLRRVNKYLNVQIDSFILECIQNEYQPAELVPFAILEDKKGASCISGLDNAFTYKTLMLYFHAIFYPKDQACKDYVRLYDVLVRTFLAECIDYKFNYYIDKNVGNCEIRIDESRVVFKLNNNVLIEAYFISKFIDQYILHMQFVEDCIFYGTRMKLIDLLELLNPYQIYEDIDIIKCTLLKRIKQISDGKDSSFDIELELLIKLVEKGIFTSLKCRNTLTHISLENIKHPEQHVRRKALELFIKLVAPDIVISEDQLDSFLLLVFEYVQDMQSGNKTSPLYLLKQVDLNELIPEKILNELLPLMAEDVGHDRWCVSCIVLLVFVKLVRKNIKLSDEFLNRLMPLAARYLQHPHWQMQETGLGFFLSLVDKDILIPKKLLNQLLPLIIEAVNRKHCRIAFTAWSFLLTFVRKDIEIPEKFLNQLLLLAFKHIQHVEWQVQNHALGLLYKLISQGAVIPEELLNLLLSSIIASLDSIHNIQGVALLLLKELILQSVKIPEAILWNGVSINRMNSICTAFQSAEPADRVEVLLPLFSSLIEHPEGEIARIAKEICVFLEKFQK